MGGINIRGPDDVEPGPPNRDESMSPKGLAAWFRGDGIAKKRVAISFRYCNPAC